MIDPNVVHVRYSPVRGLQHADQGWASRVIGNQVKRHARYAMPANPIADVPKLLPLSIEGQAKFFTEEPGHDEADVLGASE